MWKLGFLNFYLLGLLGVIAILGDYIVHHTKLHLFQALFDNATHGLVGALSWLIICLRCRPNSTSQILGEIGICTILSSAIDIDHFIVARSLNIEDATNLPKRPFLHCTTIPIVLWMVLLIGAYLSSSQLLSRCSFIVLTAFLSHHIRDATRKGIWLCPFGSTPTLPYFAYVGLTCLLPSTICWLQNTIGISQRHLNVDNTYQNL